LRSPAPSASAARPCILLRALVIRVVSSFCLSLPRFPLSHVVRTFYLRYFRYRTRVTIAKCFCGIQIPHTLRRRIPWSAFSPPSFKGCCGCHGMG
jgi:hypothetical protein